MEEKVLQMLEKEFEESELKHTCFDNLKELKKDKTLVQINAPRALIACELLGRWGGFLKGFERGFEESKRMSEVSSHSPPQINLRGILRTLLRELREKMLLCL